MHTLMQTISNILFVSVNVNVILGVMQFHHKEGGFKTLLKQLMP